MAADFSERFKQFSKFGDSKSDGKQITLSQSDKWMKQAKVIDNKSITPTDTGIHFKKLKVQKISEADYLKFLEDIAKAKKIDVEEVKMKMSNCSPPSITTTSVGTGPTASHVVERLTDSTKYSGTHKQRFDETGKGKGIAGRKDIVNQSGYVTGYANKDSYDKSHPTS